MDKLVDQIREEAARLNTGVDWQPRGNGGLVVVNHNDQTALMMAAQLLQILQDLPEGITDDNVFDACQRG